MCYIIYGNLNIMSLPKVICLDSGGKGYILMTKSQVNGSPENMLFLELVACLITRRTAENF